MKFTLNVFVVDKIVVKIGGFRERQNLLSGVCKIIDKDSITLCHILQNLVANY